MGELIYSLIFVKFIYFAKNYQFFLRNIYTLEAFRGNNKSPLIVDLRDIRELEDTIKENKNEII